MAENDTEVEAAMQAGMVLAAHREIDGTPFTVLPAGAGVEGLERYLAKPTRKRGKLFFDDVEGFNRYVKEANDVMDEIDTVIFARIAPSGCTVKAVLDYKVDGVYGWAEHCATYVATPTPEWSAWAKADRQWMNQETFAYFIEERMSDLVNPPGARMLEIATTLKAVGQVDFKSAVRLSNGTQQFIYEENTKASAGEKGDITIPERFKIGLSVFENGGGYALEAWLRFRILEKRLSFRFDLITPHLVLRDACKQIVAKIAEGTGIEPYLGHIES